MMHLFQFLLFIVTLTVANCTSLAQKREDIVYGATASKIIVAGKLTDEQKRKQLKAEEQESDALVNYIDGDWNDGFISVLSTLGNKREMRFDGYYSLSTLPAMKISIDDDLSDNAKLAVHAACRYLRKHTCVSCTKRQGTYRKYVSFKNGTRCSTEVGVEYSNDPSPFPFVVSIADDCAYVGSVLHQIMHVMGFMHENMRKDRDKYVQFHEDQAKQVFPEQFKEDVKLGYSTNPEGDPIDYKKYDLNSITHVSPFHFAIGSQPTFTVRPNLPGIDYSRVELGQREGLTRSDIKRINEMVCGARTGK